MTALGMFSGYTASSKHSLRRGEEEGKEEEKEEVAKEGMEESLLLCNQTVLFESITIHSAMS